MSITKPAVLPAWADTAVATTDIVQPANSFITLGWPLSSTPPSRQYFNWILNFVANGIRYLCRRGMVDFDTAETYLIGDIVIGDDGLLRRSLINANIGNLPSAHPTAWGAIVTATPTAGDNSSAIATTAFVTSAFASKANTSGTYPSLSVGFATSAGSATTAGSAGTAGSVLWSGVGGRPNTLAGYGISDAISTAGGTINGSLTLNGDLHVGRSDGTDVVFLNTAGNAYVYWDGSNMNLLGPAGSLFYNGQLQLTASAAAVIYISAAAAASTYLTQAAAASTYLTQQNASTTYLTPSNANATYVSKAQIHIAPDPGTVPSGSPGDVFEYY